MLLCIQHLMLQKTPQLTGEIPVHGDFMETSSLVQYGINQNHEVTEFQISMLCEVLWESIWILFVFVFFFLTELVLSSLEERTTQENPAIKGFFAADPLG